MKNRKQLLMILLGLAIFLPSPAWAQHPTSADAYIDETKLTTNFGAATTLSVKQPNLETFIRFDLSSLPSGVTGTSVGKATLVLYVSAVTTAGPFDVYEVGGAWNELTVTGSNEPAQGTLITPGVAIAAANKNNFVVIDVTAAVKDWLNGTVNNGLALVPNASAVNVTFNSKESTTTSHNPQLNISLIEPPGDITQITAGAGLTGGGTTGNVTVAVDSTVIPFLNFSNTFTGNQTVTGNISAGKLASTVATGTAPLTVSSTTQVPNLNSSLLGGLGANAFAQLAAANVFTNTQSIVGNLALPDTNGAGTAGVVTINGNPFLHDCCGAGQGNVFVGQAGNFTTTGGSNTAIGYLALLSNAAGTGNTASGFRALFRNSTGFQNTGVGGFAGNTNWTGNNNTFLGYGADSGATNLGNATAIGAFAMVAASNSLVLGGTGANAVSVGIGTATPSFTLDVKGTGSIAKDFFVGNVPNPAHAGDQNVYIENSGGDANNSFRLDGFNDILYVVADSGPFSATGASIRFRTAPAGFQEFDRVTIDPNGNVGIGVTAPAAKLDILPASNQHILVGDPGCGAFAGIGFQTTLTCNNYAVVGDSLSTYVNHPSGGTLYFRENNFNQVWINPGGVSQLISTSSGAFLSSAGVWTNNSDRNLKTRVRPVNGRQLLKRLNAIPIQTWSYKQEASGVRHMGPMAQDFGAAFGLGQDDKHIGTVDADGVALAAIQELYRAGLDKDAKIRELYVLSSQKDDQIRKLAAEVQELLRGRGEVAALEARLAHLEGARQSAKLLAKH